jgi:hypothetical protein
MAIDLAKIKAKLDQLSGIRTNSNSNAKLFKPTVGEYRIRILPWTDVPEGLLFHERHVWYNMGDKRQMVSPKHLGKSDPINDYIGKLFVESRKDPSKKELNTALAKKLFARQITCAAVIDRAAEEDGPKLWNMNPGIAKKILAIFVTGEVLEACGPEGIIDLQQGLDLNVVVTKSSKKFNGMDVNEFDIRPSLKGCTPASKDPEKIKLWMANLPKVDEFYKVTPNEEIKENFDKWLNSDDGTAVDANDKLEAAAKAVVEEKEVEAVEEKTAPTPPPPATKSVKTAAKPAPAPKKAATKFEDELDSAFAELEND